MSTANNSDWDVMMNLLRGTGQPQMNKDKFKEEWKEKLFKYKLKADGTWDGVIRFLPRPEGDGDRNPTLKVLNNAFQDVGGWYIENSPWTYGEPCPVREYNMPIYRAGGRPEKTGTKTNFYSNILVVKDPQNPENEGKVFIFKYGKGIHEAIMDKCFPKSDIDGPAIKVFHPKEGTNFKLKIKLIKTKNPKTGKEEEYPDYKSSAFNESIIPLTDDVIESTMKQLHRLSDICSPEKIKPYDVLKARFEKVMGINSTVGGSLPREQVANTSVKSEDLPDYTVPRNETDSGDEEDDFIRQLKLEMGE